MALENTQEVEEIVSHKMDNTIENLKQDLSGIHAGRVSPAMLDSIKVDYYGTPTPVSQLANITTPEPQMLAISPWEKTMIKEIERSMQAANLGFSISNDGNIIRAVTPPFTEERRKDYVKQIKKIGEDSKIAVRNVRREGNDNLKQLEKDKLISQDEEKTAQEHIQKVTDKHTALVDELVTAKEKELMTI
ncbi:MAG: ribosome recycling factor [SAR324 cluster bacterium]|nr:ribosome recycling factor [SAR324 cluster bacterium]MBL7035753.1 ribosome recycling factor [SAR324 cluster bacterium]